jgi:putative addiction module component (TIGR02574 family)
MKSKKVSNLTKAQKKELDRRYNDYQNGIGKTYTREEVIAITEQALAERRNSSL